MKNPSILPGKELDICYENIQLKLFVDMNVGKFI